MCVNSLLIIIVIVIVIIIIIIIIIIIQNIRYQILGIVTMYLLI
jgi:hypothetical protein